MTLRPAFTHAGVYTRDLEAMASFYKEVIGLIETDRGMGITLPVKLVFLSSDPAHHHQFVLSDGRADTGDSTINQLSFLVKSLDEMREIRRRVRAYGLDKFRMVNHGNAWSLYFPDPEGNLIEIYTDSPWYVPQPFSHPLDLDQSDEEILRATEEYCRAAGGMMPIEDWRAAMRDQLAR